MSFFSKTPSMQDILFELRMTSKQLSKQSDKSMKDADKEKIKVKKALENGNREAAQIYAQNVIRKRSDSNNYLKLSSRLEGVSSRLKSAEVMNKISKQMGHVVKGLSQAVNTMDLEKMMVVMDKFEDQMDVLDRQDKLMNDAMGASQTVNSDSVDALVAQMGDELKKDAPDFVSVPSSNVSVANAQDEPEDAELVEMQKRMAALRES
eukprot:m.79075 g.79075  ORF g.79075 m.79075 type:complete len:207 (+) comp25177_c0_seq1:160-780(+)